MYVMPEEAHSRLPSVSCTGEGMFPYLCYYETLSLTPTLGFSLLPLIPNRYDNVLNAGKSDNEHVLNTCHSAYTHRRTPMT